MVADPGAGRWRRRRWRITATLILATALVSSIFYLCLKDGPPPPERDELHFPRGEDAYYAGDYDAAIGSFLRSMALCPSDPRPYYRLVDAYQRKGELDAADSTLRALQAAAPDNACLHYGLGCLALKRDDLDTALAEAERASELDSRSGYARLLLGTVHNVAGRPEEAMKAWRKARKIFRAEGNRSDEAWALNRIALVHRQMSEYRRALGEFEQALELQRAVDDRQAQVIILGNLGLTEADLGDLERSLAAFDRARFLARAIGDRESESWILTNISFLDILVGDYARAIAYSDTAIALAREIGEPIDEVSGLLNCAIAYRDLGNPVRALEICRQVLPLAESILDPRHRAGVLQVMADIYLDLGRLGSARDAFSRCDSLYREIGLESGSGSARIGLCMVALQEGDSTFAMAEAERNMEAFARAGHAEGEESAALMLSKLAMHRGDHGRALAHATRAVDLSHRDGRRAREALARARRALVLLALGDTQRAARDALEGRRLALSLHSPELLWFCEMAAGDVKRTSAAEGALAHYEAAMAAVELIQRELRLEEFRAEYMADRVELYFKAAELLVDLGRPEDALLACERSRARSLSDFLAASPAPLSPQVPEPLARRSRELEAKLRTQRATLAGVAAGSGPDQKRIEALEREIARTKARWEELRTEILLQDPRFGAAMPSAALPDPGAIHAALGAGEALLEYFLGPSHSLCFVARQGRVDALRLEVGSADLAGDIEELRRPLLAPRSLTTLSYDLALAERLRHQLLDPVTPLLDGVERLVIVPDGPLNYLPFEALVLSSRRPSSSDTLFAGWGEILFVGDRYAVSYLPSASWLVLAAEAPRAKPRQKLRRDLLALGDPVPGSLPEPERGWAGGGKAGGAAAPAGAASTNTEAGPRRLIHSDREVRAIVRLFPDAELLVGSSATEGSFKALAPDFRFLHISSHGELDERLPLYSGIALGSDPSGGEDGFLHAYEVLSLPLDCELVTLSACETGLGRLYAGEGLLGLTRSFLYAGARQSLVSLWSVNDMSTAILMEAFYAKLAQGLDPGEALRDAKRSLKETVVIGADGRPLAYAHPFFWAPFVLIGAPSGG